MKIYGTGSSADTHPETAVNANSTASVTTALKMKSASLAAFYVLAASGAHSNHIITLQVSPDGTNWQDTTHTVTGVGNLHDIGCAAHSIRCKVTTAEGGASTVDITVIVK